MSFTKIFERIGQFKSEEVLRVDQTRGGE